MKIQIYIYKFAWSLQNCIPNEDKFENNYIGHSLYNLDCFSTISKSMITIKLLLISCEVLHYFTLFYIHIVVH